MKKIISFISYIANQLPHIPFGYFGFFFSGVFCTFPFGITKKPHRLVAFLLSMLTSFHNFVHIIFSVHSFWFFDLLIFNKDAMLSKQHAYFAL